MRYEEEVQSFLITRTSKVVMYHTTSVNSCDAFFSKMVSSVIVFFFFTFSNFPFFLETYLRKRKTT